MSRSCKRIPNIIYIIICAAVLTGAAYVMIFSYEGRIIRESIGNIPFAVAALSAAAYVFIPAFVSGIRKRPALLFLYFFIVPALLCALLIPAGFVPDEEKHFLRALSLSQFHVISGDVCVPENINDIFGIKGFDNLINLWSLKASDATYMTSCTMAIFYAPLSYLPQSIGVWMSSLFTDHLYVIFISARLSCLAATTAMLYLAVRIAPFGKYIIIMLSLMPLFIQEAASVAVDGLSVASVILMAAFYFYLREQKAPFTKRQIVTMALTIISVFSVKSAYLLLGFIFMLLPPAGFGGIKRKRIILLSVYILAILLPVIYWLLVYFCGFDFSKSVGDGASIMSQLSLLIGDPLKFPRVLFNTLSANAIWYFKSCFSLLLLSFDMSKAAILLLMICLVVTLLLGRHARIGWRNVIFITAASLITVIMIFGLEYLQWTGTGADMIDGVQGRYFIPLFFPILCMIRLPQPLQNADGASAERGMQIVQTLIISSTAAVALTSLMSAAATLL